MAFEPQQYSAIDLATIILDDKRFYICRTIYGNVQFYYSLHGGKDIELPNGGVSGVQAKAEFNIFRLPDKDIFLPDAIVIKEIRELLGDETKGGFSDKHPWELRLRYDHLDESYNPGLPERITVRVKKKSYLETYPDTTIVSQERNRKGDLGYLSYMKESSFYRWTTKTKPGREGIVLPKKIG